MEMAELEKVIKGLRCLSNPYIQDMDERDCDNCKYDNASCFLDVTADALSLLEAQEQEIIRLKHHIDCDAAEKIPSGCVGYGRGFNDDEPCETCKKCEKYNGYGEE